MRQRICKLFNMYLRVCF